MSDTETPSQHQLPEGPSAEFFDESDQLLHRLSENLIQLEDWVREPDGGESSSCDTDLLHEMFRATHSLQMLSMTFGQLWIAVAFLMVVGGFMLVGNVGAQSLIQHAVDSRVRARVLSLFIVFAHGLPAFGAVIMGWIASQAGLQATIGCGALVTVLVWLWARPRAGNMAAILERSDST